MTNFSLKQKTIISLCAGLLPVFAFAQATDIGSLIGIFQNIINAIIPFLVGLAIMLIIYGILGFISKAADEEKRAEARNFIIWGVVGVFIMISVWGLVNILVNTFTFSDNTSAIVGTTYPQQGTPASGSPETLMDLIAQVNYVGSGTVLPFLIGIGFFILLFGIVNYIRNGDNEEKRAEGRMFIIWGIISIFMMLSIWGFVNILVGTFNLDNTLPTGAIPVIPSL